MTNPSYDSKVIELRLRDLPRFLGAFAMNPIALMKSEFSLAWSSAIAIQVILSALSGTVAGATNQNFSDVLVGLVVFPVTSVISASVITLFIWFYFSVVHAIALEGKKLFAIVTVATIPYFALHLLSGFLPPINLIGFAFMAFLLIVGLVEQFSLDRSMVIKLIGGLSLVYFAIWSFAQWQGS